MSDDLAEWDPPSEVKPVVSDWAGEELPQLDKSTQRLMMKLRRLAGSPSARELIDAFKSETGLSLAPEGPVVADRPSGLKRVGITIQWLCPELGTRLGIGLETALVHRVIDSIIGHDRTLAQQHLPTTPVEWGFWTVLAARLTDSLNRSAIMPRLILDRVGPDPFDPSGLGACFTVAWELLHRDEPVGVLRAWVPATLCTVAEHETSNGIERDLPGVETSVAGLHVNGRIQAGVITVEGGLGRLRPKMVLPWPDAPIAGEFPALDGPVVCRLGQGTNRWSFPGRLLPESNGTQLEIIQKPKPASLSKIERRGPNMTDEASPSPDFPLTLTVELGRLSLSVLKLAQLKPGDVLELMRSSREPVDLTSGDRVVARAELVQIDQELGLRIVQTFA